MREQREREADEQDYPAHPFCFLCLAHYRCLAHVSLPIVELSGCRNRIHGVMVYFGY